MRLLLAAVKKGVSTMNSKAKEPSNAEITSAAKEGKPAFSNKEIEEQDGETERRARPKLVKVKNSKEEPSEKPPKDRLRRERERNAP